MWFLNKNYRNKKNSERWESNQKDVLERKESKLFNNPMYLEIKDNNQSSFKWWLAPKLAKMKQDNYHIVRQANNIKDIIKETEALRRASIVYGVDITNSLALINNIKFPQNKHQSFSYNNSLTNSPTKIHHQTVYTKDKVSSKYKCMIKYYLFVIFFI